MLMQRLNRFRRMLITRSDDGYFGRNPKSDSMSLVSNSKKPDAVARYVGTVLKNPSRHLPIRRYSPREAAARFFLFVDLPNQRIRIPLMGPAN